jgi:hypothetical protein
MRNVRGKKAPDCPLAASGEPHAFHRFRQGSDPSFHAIRTAFAHGAISVATSFRLGFVGGMRARAFHGGRLIAWSTGKIVRLEVNAGRRKRTGSRRNARKNRDGIRRARSVAAPRTANAVAA